MCAEGRNSLVKQKAVSLVLRLLVEFEMTGGGVATLRKQHKVQGWSSGGRGGGAGSTHPALGSRSQAWKSHHNERLRWESHCLLARMPTVWGQADAVGLLPDFHLTLASDFCGDLYCSDYPHRPPFFILQRPAQLLLFQKTTVVREDFCKPEWVEGGEECRREGTHKCV